MPALPVPNSHIIFGTGTRVGGGVARELIGLPAHALMHGWVAGKSGYGKSRFLCGLVPMLLSRGVGCILIDPAGDLARLCLKQLLALEYFAHHPDPFGNLIYLDVPGALKQNLYLPFNVLKVGHDPYTTADLVLEAVKRGWPALKSGSATTIEALIKVAAFVLSSHNMPLLPHMYTLLTDSVFRERLLADIADDLVIRFFAQHTNPKTGELALGADPTLKRLFLLAFAPVLRYSLGQPENVLDFRKILTSNRSVIINLNLPDLEAMRLLGCLMTVSVETAAKAKGELPADKRTGTHVLCMDEFPVFCAQSAEALEQILAQCRKYGLFCFLANQGFAQLPREIRGALHNCDLRVVFKMEEPDAKEAAPLLGFPIDPFLPKPSITSTPQFYSPSEQKQLHIQAITQLEKREAFLRLPGDQLYRLRSLTVDDPVINAQQLAMIEQEYIRRYFRPPLPIGKQGSAAHMPAVVTVDAWLGERPELIPAGGDEDDDDILRD